MRILIFAGTTEGRKLIEAILHAENRNIYICACVATEYGKGVLDSDIPACENLEVRQGRLKLPEMCNLMKSGNFDFAVDATHPYATAVTENIRAACQSTATKYLRLLRGKTMFGDDCVFVDSNEKAVEYLNTTEGNVLLTIGSKELSEYIDVDNFEERLYARVLPMGEVLKSCNELGFLGKHLICMQGPFSKEMNQAMLKQLDCRYMVTKDTGKEGGAYEKYQAAKETGAVLVVVGRSKQETGLTLEQVMETLGITPVNSTDSEYADEREQENKNMQADWFPLFINIKDKNVAVVGAGKIAGRRIKTLLNFSCNLRIIAKEISREIKSLAESCGTAENCEIIGCRSVELFEKEFEIEDVKGAHIVLAATNDHELNKSICDQCRKMGMLVNAVNDKEECDFYFPGIVIDDDLIVAITAQGKNHGLAKKATKSIREALKETTHE